MSGLSMFGFDQDLWEWDRTLWYLVQQCANRSPEEIIGSFGIQSEYASLVAGLSPRQVERLSSGVIASFQPVFNEETFFALLAEPYDPLSLLSRPVNGQLENHFWLLLSKGAGTSPATATLRYGVSHRVAKAAGTASTNQLRQIASCLGTSFRLRFASSIIEEVANASPRLALTKRMAYAMTKSAALSE